MKVQGKEGIYDNVVAVVIVVAVVGRTFFWREIEEGALRAEVPISIGEGRAVVRQRTVEG